MLLKVYMAITVGADYVRHSAVLKAKNSVDGLLSSAQSELLTAQLNNF